MSDFEKTYYDVAIVGGGPVGLYLALILQKMDLECIVLEKKTEPVAHSRSLGIHPVSLELMDEIGLAEVFLDEGVAISEGIAFNDYRPLGRVSFQSCPGPYCFVLSLPQYRTESVLEQHLEKQNPGALARGARVISIDETGSGVALQVRLGNRTFPVRAKLLAGCDGKESFVRKAAGFQFEGGAYHDTYIMGDFDDNTPYPSEALIYLCREGLIESFPLPGDLRRWVVKTDRCPEVTDRSVLEQLVYERTGHSLEGLQNKMISGFGVQKYVARPMARKRIFLAGDAAHIVSPIGGQGMNLGWLDARYLAGLLAGSMNIADRNIHSLANHYNFIRTTVAQKAIRRGELNMYLGRKTKWPRFRDGLVSLLLNTPLNRLMARTFTMRGLEQWPF